MNKLRSWHILFAILTATLAYIAALLHLEIMPLLWSVMFILNLIGLYRNWDT